jgi:two-component system sensor histidine kinase CpxA
MALDTRTWPLSRKILGLALLNLILIAVVLALFAQWQFGLSVESLLLGPARDRVIGIANAVGRDLDATPDASRTELLAAYSRRYGVDFYLVDPRGHSLAGSGIDLPRALLERMQNRAGPGGNRRPGPPDPGFGPRGGPPSEPAFLTMTRNPLTYWIGVRMPINGPQGERGVPAVLLLRANSIFNSQLFFDWRSLLWLAATLAAVALLCWWPFVHRVTRSIREMDRATEEIALGRFDNHVTLRRRDELGHLGQQINRMAGRLEGFVTHQKRFLGDIAHELSAPIARIQFALGILEQKAGDAQQTHVDVLRDEIQEMSGLVNELLMFSKAGMRAAEAPLKPVALSPVVQRAVSHQVPGSAPIQVGIAPGLAVIAYEPYLLRAISNLLRNALRYAGEDGPIAVTARRDGGQVLLTVSDCGPGLPEQSLEEVFVPFYRPESARSRDTGGAGLGLAIVKSCVEACKGTVACRNRKPSGLEVTISLATGECDSVI